MTQRSFAVIGAGMVGVCCALELQARGHRVTLFERGEPGGETSSGNAGVAARSSLVPLNHPGLWQALPSLLGNRSGALRYSPAYALRRVARLAGFLGQARQRPFEQTTKALDALIVHSRQRHRHWASEARAQHLWRHDGWLYLYRSRQAYEAARSIRETWSGFGVAHETLDAHALRSVEPGLGSGYPLAVWVRDADSASDPRRVVQAYAALFVNNGGRLLQAAVQQLTQASGQGWLVHSAGRPAEAVDEVVVALGPWSPALLGELGLKVPMLYERGYHMHYGWNGVQPLVRPVYDTGAACVLAPMGRGLRLSTGVELNDLDAPASSAQLDMAERAVRTCLPLGARLDTQAWTGARPTLPDSRPAIGASSRLPGLWLALGHQHIGFSTGPGTAALLGSLVDRQPTPFDPRPFAPGRFRL
ncbi:MAG: FAD-binding oxidoreductase [Hydrogenophaga sp.]|nr:FAD-binding oxidoreductase [Hydrogenophaga sp.]